MAWLALLAALAQLHLVNEPDVWWHLWGAQQVLESHSWTFPDHSTFTQDGWLWHNAEWGFQLLLLAAWRLGGGAGLQLLVAGFAAATVGVLGVYVRRFGSSGSWMGIGQLAVVVAVIVHSFTARPQLASFLFLGLTLIVLELPSSWRRGALLVGLQLVWSHLHSSHVILPVVAGLALVGRMIEGDRRGWRAELGLVAVLAGVSLALGPLGIGVVPEVLDHAGTDSAQHIGDMRPPGWSDLLPEGLGPETWFTVLAACVVARLWSGGVRVRDVLLLVFGVAMLVVAVRFMAMTAILALPLLLERREGARTSGRGRVAELGGVLALIVAVPASWWAGAVGVPWMAPGLGVWSASLPEDAIEVLSRSAGGHLYNHYDDGGYLVWRLAPELAVAIDGRTPTFHTVDHHALWRQSTRSLATFQGMDARWGIDHALVDRDLPLCTKLEAHPEWRLVYLDARRSLFTKDQGSLLPGVSLQLPACSDSPTVGCPASVEQASAWWDETTALLELTPQAHYPWLLRLRLLACTEHTDAQAALGIVEQALDGEVFPDDRMRAALLTLRAGDALGALELASKAAEAGGDARIDLFRGRVLMQLGRDDEGAQRFLAAAAELDDSMMLTDRLDLARACHRAGLVDQAAEQALRVAATGDPQALALLQDLLPQLDGPRADDVRGWIEAWAD